MGKVQKHNLFEKCCLNYPKISQSCCVVIDRYGKVYNVCMCNIQ
jgi:hypothetical protein